MASIFKKIGNFLNKDEVRAGLALGSTLGGFGAFDGMKYGDTIKSTLGGLNLASGLRAGGASGALQAGLGGYGLAQGLGKVGTFGNTFDTLMGKKTAKPMYTNMGPPRNFASPKVKVSALPSFSEGGYRMNAPFLQGVDGESQMNIMGNIQDEDMGFKNTGGVTMGSGKTDQLYRSTVQNNYAPTANTNTNMSVDGGLYAANNRVVNNNNNVDQQMTLASNNLPTGGGQRSDNFNVLTDTNRSGGYGFSNDGGKGKNFTDFQNVDAGGLDIYSPYGTSAPGFYPNTVSDSNNDGSQTFANFSFERVMDNIVAKAMKDPLQAVAVGSALVTAFADDPKEEAAKQYAAEMARVRAQTDPNSDFGQNYMSSFADRRTKELDDAYTKATSDFVATMSKRGMLDSTVFTEGKASLDAKFAELKAKIPFDSQIALQDYQKAQLTNLNLGSQAAYRGGALNAGITNPFSNSFKAAVASTKS